MPYLGRFGPKNYINFDTPVDDKSFHLPFFGWIFAKIRIFIEFFVYIRLYTISFETSLDLIRDQSWLFGQIREYSCVYKPI